MLFGSVTPSIGRSRTVELVRKVAEAFRNTAGIRVIIKLHPSMRIEYLQPYLGKVELPAHVSFSAEPVGELLTKSNVLVYNDGTFPSAEALAFGVPVVFVEPEHGLSLDSLDGFPQVRSVARTPAQILEAVQNDLATGSGHDEDGLAAVRQLVGPVTPGVLSLFED